MANHKQVTRTERFTTLLTTKEHETWKSRALLEGFDSLSAYLRWAITKEIRESEKTKRK